MFFVCLCVCLFVWRKLLANLVAQVIHIYLIFAVLGIKVGRFAGAGDLLGASVALIVCFVSLVCLFVLCLLFVCLFVRSYFFSVLGLSAGSVAGAGGLLGTSGQRWTDLGPWSY